MNHKLFFWLSRRPCGPDLPARRGPDRGLLRVSLRGRGPGHDPAAAPAEPADDVAHGQDDRRRVQVGRRALLAAGHQAAQVEGECGVGFTV